MNSTLNPTFIFIDGSYFCFYRYHSLLTWWKNAYPEEKDVLQNLLICFIQKKRWKEVEITTGNLLNMEIKDVIMFQNILSVYEAHAANEILIENLLNQLKINPNDKPVAFRYLTSCIS